MFWIISGAFLSLRREFEMKYLSYFGLEFTRGIFVAQG